VNEAALLARAVLSPSQIGYQGKKTARASSAATFTMGLGKHS
jgi:hypothetical protein